MFYTMLLYKTFLGWWTWFSMGCLTVFSHNNQEVDCGCLSKEGSWGLSEIYFCAKKNLCFCKFYNRFIFYKDTLLKHVSFPNSLFKIESKHFPFGGVLPRNLYVIHVPAWLFILKDLFLIQAYWDIIQWEYQVCSASVAYWQPASCHKRVTESKSLPCM